MLASQAEIDVWVQHRGRLRESGGIAPGNLLDYICKILQSLAVMGKSQIKSQVQITNHLQK